MVLVLDGNENQAVATVRSLARAGHTVTVGADTRWSKAGWSRDCSDSFQYPPPQEDAEAFLDAVVDRAAQTRGTLVLPMTERTTLPISRARQRLIENDSLVVLPPHDTVLRAFDKDQTTRLAASLGIDVPATVVVESRADLDDAAAALRFPVVLKPRSSEEFVPGGGVRTTGAPLYARTAGELLRAWESMSARCGAALAQEFVDGAGVGYFALMRHGDLRAEFAHRRIRDVRPTGSGSALRMSVAVDPRVGACGAKLLRALEWHGVAMVEFRLRGDGTPVFLEINGRFWNSLALAVHAGVDFPALVAELAGHGDVDAPRAYAVGVRCRWLLGDARHLVEVMRGAPAGFPGAFPSRLATLGAVLTPVPGTRHDNFEWRDPAPELGDWLDFALRKLPRRVAAANADKVWDATRRASHP